MPPSVHRSEGKKYMKDTINFFITPSRTQLECVALVCFNEIPTYITNKHKLTLGKNERRI